MKLVNKCLIVVGVMTSFSTLAGTVSNTANASANVLFSASTRITNTLTPVVGLSAGVLANKTVLASGEVTLNDSSTAIFALTGSPSNPFSESGFEATGYNNSANKLFYAIRMYGVFREENEVIDGVTWVVPTNRESLSRLDYGVVTFNKQSVNADTYHISIDVAVYNS